MGTTDITPVKPTQAEYLSPTDTRISPVSKALIGHPGALVSPKGKARALSFALRKRGDHKKRGQPSPVANKLLSNMRSPVKKQKQLALKFNSPSDSLFSPVTKALVVVSKKQRAELLFNSKAKKGNSQQRRTSSETGRPKQMKIKKVNFALYVDQESHKSFPRTPGRKKKLSAQNDENAAREVMVRSKCKGGVKTSTKKRKDEKILQELSLNAPSPIRQLF